MMSKKATNLYNRMQHGISKKKAKVDLLTTRRKEIEKKKEKDNKGNTPGKQKVERLKKERKKVEDDYADTGGTMKKNKRNTGRKR